MMSQNSSKSNLIAYYDVTYNNFATVFKQGTLFQLENEIFYIEEPNLNNELSDENDNRPISAGSKKPTINRFELNRNIITSSETFPFAGKWFTISEKIPIINFTITDRKKKIGKYNCTFAKAIFRGREYEFWFTEDIAISAGPWKFNGLPGLVITAKSSDGKIFWNLKKIETKKIESTQLKNFVIQFEEGVKYSLKEFVKVKDKSYQSKVQNYTNNIRARLPRGTTMTAEYVEGRKGKELIYEWETTDEKK